MWWNSLQGFLLYCAALAQMRHHCELHLNLYWPSESYSNSTVGQVNRDSTCWQFAWTVFDRPLGLHFWLLLFQSIDFWWLYRAHSLTKDDASYCLICSDSPEHHTMQTLSCISSWGRCDGYCLYWMRIILQLWCLTRNDCELLLPTSIGGTQCHRCYLSHCWGSIS